MEPKHDGGSRITGYVVEKSQGEVYDFVTCGEVTSEVRSHKITELSDATRYDVRVSAVNSEGRGQASDVLASVLTGDYTCEFKFLNVLFFVKSLISLFSYHYEQL